MAGRPWIKYQLTVEIKEELKKGDASIARRGRLLAELELRGELYSENIATEIMTTQRPALIQSSTSASSPVLAAAAREKDADLDLLYGVAITRFHEAFKTLDETEMAFVLSNLTPAAIPWVMLRVIKRIENPLDPKAQDRLARMMERIASSGMVAMVTPLNTPANVRIDTVGEYEKMLRHNARVVTIKKTS